MPCTGVGRQYVSIVAATIALALHALLIKFHFQICKYIILQTLIHLYITVPLNVTIQSVNVTRIELRWIDPMLSGETTVYYQVMLIIVCFIQKY